MTEDALLAYAHQLNRPRLPWPLPPFYEVMSDALIWPDESPPRGCPVEVTWALRPVWHYRTGLILGEEWRFRAEWERALTLFPRWRGFRPARRRQSRRLAEVYRSGQAAFDHELAELEAALDDDGTI